ncbi:uncharacterized protein [Haliotis cracherodii]|uniref:uncharacterized protein n=1 Tax=Haliotis cracherodii TaxID=6455 RepID=UPI0039EA5BF9
MPSAADRNIVIGHIQRGESQSSVASHFNVHHSTICRLCGRYTQFNSTADGPRTSRLKVTTPAQDRFIGLFHLRHRNATAMETAERIPGLRRMSDQTVRNHLREAGIRPRRPAIVPVLQQIHRQRRLLFIR